MQDGWFIVLGLIGFLTFVGVAVAFWLSRVVAQHREKETLTATDLRLLQETVEALIERLKVASDEAVGEIELRQKELQALLDRVDEKLPGRGAEAEGLDLNNICRLAQEGMAETEIARRVGANRGEIELMLEMQAARRG